MKNTTRILFAIFCVFIMQVFSINVFSKNRKNKEKQEEENRHIIIEEQTNVDSIFFEEEIIIPDQIDLNLSNLYDAWNKITIERREKDCISKPENPNYTDQEYIERLSRLPTVIEMPYNKVVRSFINFYLDKKREQVEKMLGLGQYFFPIFEEELNAQDMPIELKYLPVIESALNPMAFSKAGASGLWQFMMATGKIYGLTVNTLVDERRDPVKSTQAGVKYLKDLYNIYNDWHLAIAAYNCGPGNVNKAIRRSGGKKDYWQIYSYLPKETRGYVPAFIAANYVMTYYSQHNLCPIIPDVPLNTDTILVTKKIHLQQVADVLELPIENLRSINPQYKKDIIPGHSAPYALSLPLNYANVFIDRQDSIFSYKADELVNVREEVTPLIVNNIHKNRDEKIYYRVKSGDYLGKIASTYGVSVSDIKRWNHLRSNSIQVGKRLIIYSTRKVENHYVTSGNKIQYKVQPGDSLWSISKKFPGTSVSQIQQANSLNSNHVLKTGQMLHIPQK